MLTDERSKQIDENEVLDVAPIEQRAGPQELKELFRIPS